MRHHSNQYMLERLKDKSHDSPEQVCFNGDCSARSQFKIWGYTFLGLYTNTNNTVILLDITNLFKAIEL